MRQRIILLLIVIMTTTLTMMGAAWAAPDITDVTGTYATGQEVTITGTGFGTKSPAPPLVWDTFEDGAYNLAATVGAWDYLNTGSHAVSSSIKHSGTYGAQGTTGGSISTFEKRNLTITAGSRLFLYLWRRYENSVVAATNQKTIRIYSNSMPANFVAVIHGDDQSPGVGVSLCRYATEHVTGGTLDWSESFGVPAAQTWYNEIYRFGFPSTKTSATGVYEFWRGAADGSFMNKGLNSSFAYWNSSYTSDYDRFVIDSFRGEPTDTYTYYADDIYLDNTWSRVMLGNASTLATCTHLEMLIPSAWSDTSITATFNAGTFTNGQTAYVFVVVDQDNVPSSGYMVTIGSSEEDILPPALSGKYPSALLPAGTTSAPVGFISDEPCTCRWSGTAGTAYANMANTFSTTGGTSHESTFSGLTDGSSQTIYARCIDGTGNPNTTDLDITIAVEEQSPATSYRIIKRGTVTVVVP